MISCGERNSLRVMSPVFHVADTDVKVVSVKLTLKINRVVFEILQKRVMLERLRNRLLQSRSRSEKVYKEGVRGLFTQIIEETRVDQEINELRVNIQGLIRDLENLEKRKETLLSARVQAFDKALQVNFRILSTSRSRFLQNLIKVKSVTDIYQQTVDYAFFVSKGIVVVEEGLLKIKQSKDLTNLRENDFDFCRLGVVYNKLKEGLIELKKKLNSYKKKCLVRAHMESFILNQREILQSYQFGILHHSLESAKRLIVLLEQTKNSTKREEVEEYLNRLTSLIKKEKKKLLSIRKNLKKAKHKYRKIAIIFRELKSLDQGFKEMQQRLESKQMDLNKVKESLGL